MREIKSYLTKRREEMEQHLTLLQNLDERSKEPHSRSDPFRVEVRQVLILKSSILVHLYNIVEATMNQVLEELARQVSSHHPKTYTKAFFREWVKHTAGTNNGAGPDTLLDKVTATGRELISNSEWSSIRITRGSGNWDDIEIRKIATRLCMTLSIEAKIARAASEDFIDNESRLVYVRKKRNSLAHGHSTFEEGAQDRTYLELSELAKIVLDYIDAVVDCFSRFAETSAYIENQTAEAS